jgi:hypothetical protein
MIICDLCGELMLAVGFDDHLRVFHPDDYEPMETWPDGSLVIVDTTLEPADFV